jgi:hypothetical protein
MIPSPAIGAFKNDLIKLGYPLKNDGVNKNVFGMETDLVVRKFQREHGLKEDGVVGMKTKTMIAKLLKTGKPVVKPRPVIEKPKKDLNVHRKFVVPEGYTHIHPLDALRSYNGEREIPGKRDNPHFAHSHEHSRNLGTHSDQADYHDEVAHCSSMLNMMADFCGCDKTDSALAMSWMDYGQERTGDIVYEGDLICLKIGKQWHITLANKTFNRKKERTFEGFGSNQGNSVKNSIFSTKVIESVRIWHPKVGTHLAPIGTKPIPVTGHEGESTR